MASNRPRQSLFSQTCNRSLSVRLFTSRHNNPTGIRYAVPAFRIVHLNTNVFRTAVTHWRCTKTGKAIGALNRALLPTHCPHIKLFELYSTLYMSQGRDALCNEIISPLIPLLVAFCSVVYTLKYCNKISLWRSQLFIDRPKKKSTNEVHVSAPVSHHQVKQVMFRT